MAEFQQKNHHHWHQQIREQNRSSVAWCSVVLTQACNNVSKAISEEPADVGHHRSKEVVAAFQPPAAEAQDRDGEVGVGHLVLEGAIGPTNQFGRKLAEEKVENKSPEPIDAQPPKGNPEKGAVSPTRPAELMASFQAAANQGDQDCPNVELSQQQSDHGRP